MSGLPGLVGTEHVGFTVPDLDAAIRFFTVVIGCTAAYQIGPFQADDDWMARQLGVSPRAVIRKLAMLRCKTGPNFELFEYELDGKSDVPPANSDVGGHHLAFYVADIFAAVDYLKTQGITVQGNVVTMQDGPSGGLSWVYFLAPWGMQLELVSAPQGQAVTQQDPTSLWVPLGPRGLQRPIRRAERKASRHPELARSDDRQGADNPSELDKFQSRSATSGCYQWPTWRAGGLFASPSA